MTLRLKLPTAPAYKDDLQALLDEYEEAEREIQEIRENHPEIFERLVDLEDTKETAHERMKRLVYVRKEPPVFLKGKHYGAAARGDVLQIDIQYKRKRDYYDPKQLPQRVLQMPGIVVEVDSVAVEAVLETTRNDTLRAAIQKARVKGEWMTPSLSIKRQEE